MMNSADSTSFPSAHPAAAYDTARNRCTLSRDLFPGLSVLRHADVCRILEDPRTFSNAVSAHLSVPNGMDPPEHTPFRKLIEPYFAPEQMAEFEPVCRRIAAELTEALPRGREFDFMARFAREFALRIQCAFLGWPDAMREALWTWLGDNQLATARGDRSALRKNARVFEDVVQSLLQERREAHSPPERDVTSRLMHETVHGRRLRDTEIVSILRNWTAGEVGTISASVGILAAFCAQRPAVQERLRRDPARLTEANDEMLRIHAPLLTNRRVTTSPVRLGGEDLPAGTKLTLVWAAANRDPKVFDQPDEFRLDRDPSLNLLWGKGIHVCPGAPLAKLELRVMMEELLAHTRHIETASSPLPASPPAAGYQTLPLLVR